MSLFRKLFGQQDDPDALTARGMKCMQRGDARQAVELFAAATSLDPGHGEAWYGKGCAHAQLGEHDDAIQAYEQSARFAGERASLPLYNLGVLYQELARPHDAVRCFRRVTESDPTMADAWINLGRLTDDAGHHVEAIQYYDTALELAPDDAMAWSNRGNSLRSLDRFDEALDSYQKALALDEDDFAAKIGVAACLVEYGQPEKGIADLQALSSAVDHPLVRFELATALAKTEQPEAALALYDRLLAAKFLSAQIWNNRAECLARLGQTEAALESFGRAIEFDPQFAPAWFGKARVLINSDQLAEAQLAARRYLELADDTERQQPHAQALAEMCRIDD